PFHSVLFFSIHVRTLLPPLFPYTTLFRSRRRARGAHLRRHVHLGRHLRRRRRAARDGTDLRAFCARRGREGRLRARRARPRQVEDRKSTRLNSSHVSISYAVFCLKKKKKS